VQVLGYCVHEGVRIEAWQLGGGLSEGAGWVW